MASDAKLLWIISITIMNVSAQSVQPPSEPVIVTSDGLTDASPHCSWWQDCEYTEATKNECADVLCRLQGFTGGNFLSSSNNFCTDSFTNEKCYRYEVDYEDIAYSDKLEESQITAACESDPTYKKLCNRYCIGEYGYFETVQSAKEACSNDTNCKGVYDVECDGEYFYLCPKSATFRYSGRGSCIYQKTEVVIEQCKADFVDSIGANCTKYVEEKWCTANGSYGETWNFESNGPFSLYGVGGLDAFACPGCGCGVHDHCIQCNPWPTSGYHGCSGGDGWKLLDKATVDASMCKSLCIQHASGDGCCYVSGSGCYWNGGATSASSSSCSDGHCLSMECSVAACPLTVDASCTDTHNYLSHGGIIKSPAYPECYPVDRTCTWNLSVPIGFEIRIEQFIYGIEDCSGCSCDYLNIYDNVSNVSAPIANLCDDVHYMYSGSTSTGRNLFIEFYSDDTTVESGFQFRLFVIDADECTNGNHDCDANADCTNTVGSFTCTCHPGFTGDGNTCTDVDECAMNSTNDCSANANCENTEGAFTCTCTSGFAGDGRTCTDVDECALASTNDCSTNADCSNTVGSFNCTCKSGFAGNGNTCEDVDECAVASTNDCNANADCENTAGSFTCTCKFGYGGDGKTCTATTTTEPPKTEKCKNRRSKIQCRRVRMKGACAKPFWRHSCCASCGGCGNVWSNKKCARLTPFCRRSRKIRKKCKKGCRMC